MIDTREPLLSVRDLKMHFPIREGLLSRTIGFVKAVDGVTFHVNRGEAVGLVGESGSGKTTTGRCVVRLYQPTGGSIELLTADGVRDITRMDKNELRPIRRNIQMLFQDPNSSLNARMRIADIVAEPLEIHRIGTQQTRRERVAELLAKVGLNSDILIRFPHQLSGGQRQRVGVARALSTQPELIICDEPVSALDVSVQAQVLNLLKDLQAELGLTYLFIAHDLSVVEYISDRVIVMYLGLIVESAETRRIFTQPAHPYTEALLNAIPRREAGGHRQRIVLAGDIPSPVNPPSGCVFHTRCKYVQDVCKSDVPLLKPLARAPEILAACHFADTLALQPFPIDSVTTPSTG
jgi:oligopeptide transport system ATP-binding protein